MTPDDIRSQRFGARLLRGLSPEEVSAFLEDVADAYDDVQKTNASLTARVKVLEEKETPASSHIEVLRAVALQEVEALLHDAQAQAQALIDGAKEREATALRDAEAAKAQRLREAEELVAAATEQEAAIRNEIDRLTQSHLQLVDDVRATLDTYHQWLATVDPRGRAWGRREGFGTPNEVRVG